MSLTDILYPKRCPVCLAALPPGKDLICTPCRKKIRYVKDPVCFKCGRPLASELREYCSECERNMPVFIRNIAWAEYGSFYTRRMLSEVKYHGNRQILDYPCLDFSRSLKPVFTLWKPDVLIPVPIHEKRLHSRGYNQAAEIAERIGKALQVPVDSTSLMRTAETAAQKNLSRSMRALNLLSAFSWQDSPYKYETAVLVDDIYTTGATLNACTGVLLRAGIRNVYCITLSIGRTS